MDYDFDDDEPEMDDPANELTDQASYICDSCGEEIVVPLDYSEGHSQQYVEDCPVCCNPNLIFVDVDEFGQIQISSRAEQDRN